MLEEALNSRVKSTVLKFLSLNPAHSYTPTEVAAYCELSKSRVSETLHSFEDNDLVSASYAGKSILYSLNQKSQQARLVIQLFTTDYEESLEPVNQLVDDLKNNYRSGLLAVILYGKRARGAFGALTEYDILVLTKGTEKISVPTEGFKVRTVDLMKFAQMGKKQDPLILELLLGYRTLYDKGVFQEMVASLHKEMAHKNVTFTEHGKKWSLRKVKWQ